MSRYSARRPSVDGKGKEESETYKIMYILQPSQAAQPAQAQPAQPSQSAAQPTQTQPAPLRQ